jgi:hypothetical protein
MRAMLLLLFDRFERNIKYLEFLKKKNFITSSAFDHARSKISKSRQISKTSELRPAGGKQIITLRILSIDKYTNNYPSRFLAVNKFRQFFFGVIDYQLVTDEMVSNTVISCLTENIHQKEGDVWDIKLSEDESYVRAEDDDPAIPRSSGLKTKIHDVPGWLYIIEGEIMQTPIVGNSYDPVSEYDYPTCHTVIRDETGQISVEERNNLYMQNMNRGDYVRVIGGQSVGDGILLSEFGSIVKLRS